MKRTLIIATVIAMAVLFGSLAVSCSGESETVVTVPEVVEGGPVVAEGMVLPVKRAHLAFSVIGRVSTVRVEAGDEVSAGRLLVGLDDTAARAAVAAADAAAAAAAASITQADAAADAAQAAIDKAEATKDGLGDASEWRLDAADADIRLAQAQLAAAKADATAAAAQQSEAQSRAEQARAALDELTIEAPFAGTIISVNVEVGDEVAPAMVVLRIADLSAWEIETTDLSEGSIAGVQEGSAATLTLDALPDVEAAGTVTEIGLVGEAYQGSTVFRVTVTPDQPIEGLRWGMTATVEIKTED